MVNLFLILGILFGNLHGGWVCYSKDGINFYSDKEAHSCGDCKDRPSALEISVLFHRPGDCSTCIDIPLPEFEGYYGLLKSSRNFELPLPDLAATELPGMASFRNGGENPPNLFSPRAPPNFSHYFAPLEKIILLL